MYYIENTVRRAVCLQKEKLWTLHKEPVCYIQFCLPNLAALDKAKYKGSSKQR